MNHFISVKTCQKMLIVSLLTLVCGWSAAQDATFNQRSEQAIEQRVQSSSTRFGYYYAGRMNIFLHETTKQNGIVFLGDSITEGFQLATAFRGKNVINRGIGGDGVDGVIARLDISVQELNPKKVYLLIGINNLNYTSTPEQMAKLKAKYAELVQEIRKVSPKTELIIQSVFPLTGGFAKTNPKVLEFNEFIKQLAHDNGLAYIDIHKNLRNDKGELKSDYTGDGIHLTIDGYIIWLETILQDDQECLAAIRNLLPQWVNVNSSTYPVAKIDPPRSGIYPGNRGMDEIVIYTPAYTSPTTGTNIYGKEVVVRNGVVVETNTNNSTIPADGYVISGHNKAGIWIQRTLPINTQVGYTNTKVTVKELPESQLSNEQKYNKLKGRYYTLLLPSPEKKTPAAATKQELDVFKLIRAIDTGKQTLTTAQMKLMKTKLDLLEKHKQSIKK